MTQLAIEKETVVQRLCAHYAQDHLSTGELERRFELVQQAVDRPALLTVLEGLPALGPTVAPPAPLWQTAAPGGTLAPLGSEQRFVAFFSEVKKEGRWRAGPLIRARAVLGTVVLDLREAEIPLDGLEIDLEVYLGEGRVILPPGIGADVDCSAVLAEVKDKAGAGLPGAPRVRVRGGAVLGELVVQTKLPRKERLEGWRAQLNRWLWKGGA